MREADITLEDVDFAAMGIAELVALGRQAGILDFEELACHGNGAVVQSEVKSRYDEDRLSALEYVEEWEHVTETNNGHLYVISFTAPALSEEQADRAGDLLGPCDTEIDEDRATLSVVGPQSTIAETIRGYESAGATPELERLGRYRGGHNPVDQLTDRQREVIETAFEMGFYDVPRNVSTKAVAAELDLDPSTVSEHLQRAERNLLEALL